ncbi:sensory box histidine kinase NtrB [Alcanivorax hongdengensis A-11-3]|uniref:Sensory histidine kinase/phosphatase NtrB n=1 Tax=Alcanivorax hongdengensis A-11-3 TaxID=1177179 RepID=L0WIX5_9GAMM|nr:nitrogen regulation protein NR(II) [Alcanivorax hongdengensis]EKF76137.1 sensory box histidine kinase NtrB [Alcanivorax hongdengensis A-11-3]
MGQFLMSDSILHKRLLDHLRTAVVMLDASLRVRYLNPAAEMLLATSASRIIGQVLPDYFFDDEEARQALNQCIEDEHPFTRREARLMVAPGYQITVDYSVSPINEPGQPLSLLLEMQSLDRLLRITREEALIHAHQATRALVRGVAHEIKNPLGGIRGAAQLLERALPEPELTEYTKVIIDEADRLRSVADRMLGPRKPPLFMPVNVHECLEHVRQLLLAEHPEGVAIVRDYDISLPDVVADRDQLIQVLLNLIRNAVQALLESHTPEATIVMRTRVLRQFTIGAQRHRLVLRVDIEDNGPGIAEEIQETLFYPMVSGRANGSGLGLSIAQSIISQHQGLIECESEPGKTVFSLLLPMEQPELTESSEP